MKKLIGGALFALTLIFSVGMSEASAQWRRGDRDWRRDNGRYQTVYQQQELNRGYQQGIQTGASDAQRGQNYSPQRSRYYQRAGSVPFREGFVRGYDQGYRQYAGYQNNRGYGGYGYGNQQELNRGYQQGIETGSSDAQRRQSYDPQRSKHWRNARTQEFREGFARGYDEGYRRYAYNNGTYRNNSGIGIADILGGILGRP
ncbi:MAG TPA: hypothetical protein VJV03_11175 [Pyrinomonadaceae bacterium]|nr:hypothetical protein [Pyrinomonadaceae bacterium]